ncbi:MAG: hypothetical protein ACRC62_21890 [Microcoleus sp.]
MKPTSISVSYDRSFNLGNYESVKIGAQMWAQIDEDEAVEDVMAYCFEQCKLSVKDNVPPHYQPQPTTKTTGKISGIEVVE